MHNKCDNDTAINVVIEVNKNYHSVTKTKDLLKKTLSLSLTLLQSLL